MSENKTRRRIEPGGSQQFVVSEQNPNDTCGGDCACGQHPTDQKGPFIVFRGRAFPRGGRTPAIVVCAPCAKTAVLGIERGDEVAIVGAASPQDIHFDGGEADAPPDYQKLKGRYESECAGLSLLEVPTFNAWLDAKGYDGNRPADLKTGIDPNAKTLVQARAATSPVGMKGGAVHGRIDDPAEQLANPDNWGVPEPAK